MKKSKCDSSVPNSISVNNSVIDEPSEIANEFNRHFTSLGIACKIDEKECENFINRTFRENAQLLPKIDIDSNDINGKFNFSKTTNVIMTKYLDKLDASSSPGITAIPICVLKSCASKFAPLLTKLFNDCIDKCVFPDEFKIACVTPLLKKKGLGDDMNNYRGISVLPPVGKIFEKILAEQMRIYFNINGLLFAGQHGFRQGHSCDSALHEVISDCLKNMDQNFVNLLLFIDFTKAFDMVKHSLLFKKLLNYGFSNSALKMLENYFNSRKQCVKIGSQSSKEAMINLGVPQGSILGPLLFLIYINDLPFSLNDTNTTLFADDTTLSFHQNSVENAIIRLKNATRLLILWCEHNQLYINWSKTKAMFITNKRVKWSKEIAFDNVKIEVVDHFKLLGVWLDCKLSFNHHVDSQINTINSKMFAIRRLFYLSGNVKEQFFKTFILPYFDYCLSLVIYYSKTALNRLARCYYKCIHIVLKLRIEQSMDIFQINEKLSFHYGLVSFNHRIIERLSTFAYKIMNYSTSPQKLKSFLAKNDSKILKRKDNWEIIKPDRCMTIHGDRCFKNFYAVYFNKIKENRELFFTTNFDEFHLKLSSYSNEIVSKSTSLFKLFDLKINFNFMYI